MATSMDTGRPPIPSSRPRAAAALPPPPKSLAASSSSSAVRVAPPPRSRPRPAAAAALPTAPARLSPPTSISSPPTVATPATISLPSILTELIESIHKRLQDLESYQLPQLDDCQGPLSLHEELAASVRSEIAGVRRDLEELKGWVEDLDKEKEIRAGWKQIDAIHARLNDVIKAYKEAVIHSKQVVDSQLSPRDELMRSNGASGRGGPKSDVPVSADDALMSATSQVTDGLRSTMQLMQQQLDQSLTANDILESSTATMALTSNQYSTFSSLLSTSKALISSLEKADYLDRLLLIAAFTFFVLVCIYIFKRRLVDKGLRAAGVLSNLVARGKDAADDYPYDEPVFKRAITQVASSIIAESAETVLAVSSLVATVVASARAAAGTVEPKMKMERAHRSAGRRIPDLSPAGIAAAAEMEREMEMEKENQRASIVSQPVAVPVLPVEAPAKAETRQEDVVNVVTEPVVPFVDYRRQVPVYVSPVEEPIVASPPAYVLEEPVVWNDAVVLSDEVINTVQSIPVIAMEAEEIAAPIVILEREPAAAPVLPVSVTIPVDSSGPPTSPPSSLPLVVPSNATAFHALSADDEAEIDSSNQMEFDLPSYGGGHGSRPIAYAYVNETAAAAEVVPEAAPVIQQPSAVVAGPIPIPVIKPEPAEPSIQEISTSIPAPLVAQPASVEVELPILAQPEPVVVEPILPISTPSLAAPSIDVAPVVTPVAEVTMEAASDLQPPIADFETPSHFVDIVEELDTAAASTTAAADALIEPVHAPVAPLPAAASLPPPIAPIPIAPLPIAPQHVAAPLPIASVPTAAPLPAAASPLHPVIEAVEAGAIAFKMVSDEDMLEWEMAPAPVQVAVDRSALLRKESIVVKQEIPAAVKVPISPAPLVNPPSPSRVFDDTAAAPSLAAIVIPIVAVAPPASSGVGHHAAKERTVGTEEAVEYVPPTAPLAAVVPEPIAAPPVVAIEDRLTPSSPDLPITVVAAGATQSIIAEVVDEPTFDAAPVAPIAPVAPVVPIASIAPVAPAVPVLSLAPVGSSAPVPTAAGIVDEPLDALPAEAMMDVPVVRVDTVKGEKAEQVVVLEEVEDLAEGEGTEVVEEETEGDDDDDDDDDDLDIDDGESFSFFPTAIPVDQEEEEVVRDEL